MSTAPPERFLTIAWLERRSRRQRQVVVGILVLYVAWRFLRAGARLLLDRWWFEAVTDSPVWTTKFWAC